MKINSEHLKTVGFIIIDLIVIFLVLTIPSLLL